MANETGTEAGNARLRLREGDPLGVCIEGDLDFIGADRVRGFLAQLLESGRRHLLIDLENVGYVDSSGMLALISVAHQAARSGGSARLASPPPTLPRMVNLSPQGEVLGLPLEPAPAARRRFYTDTGVGRWDVFRLVVPAAPSLCASVRRAVIEEAAETPLGPQDRADLELAVGEAFANAVRHGSPAGDQSRVVVRILRGGDAIVVEVTDQGQGFDRSTVSTPEPDEVREGGLGVFYMEALMDTVEFETTARGTTVRLVKAYPREV